MKFVKQNLTLLICALVVVLSIVSIFWPFGSLLAGEQQTAQERYNNVTGSAKAMESGSLVIPGAATQHGPPTKNFTDAKKEANETLSRQATDINKTSSDYNRNGRVDVDPKDPAKVTPILDGKPERFFLPKIQEAGVPMQFREDYENLLKKWMTTLVGSSTPAYPPRKEDLANMYAAILKAQDAAKPGGSSIASTPNPREQMAFERAKVMETAANIHIYVDPTAIQLRAWYQTDNPPNEQNIFESLVDCWFMGDVVKAIAMVNDDALTNARAKSVAYAPVKRLLRVSVGNDSVASRMGTITYTPPTGQPPTGTVASLFVLSNASTSADATPAPGTSPPNTIDPLRSMTGRASGNDYDVVLMEINLDIDPSYLNKFIDALYRQNMGYTVLRIKTKTVDPLDRASNGFVYGDTQVIEVEILVEGLLFRNWTLPIMPDPIRTQLGIALDVPAPPR